MITARKEIQLEGLTISTVHSAYQDGTYTCRDLVQAYIERIEAIDRAGPNIGAIVTVSSTALKEAADLDAHFKSCSQFLGPLHGVPVVIKDNIETNGLTTTFGSVVAKDHVPMEDATLVRRLRRAGAVILAKGSLPGKNFIPLIETCSTNRFEQTSRM